MISHRARAVCGALLVAAVCVVAAGCGSTKVYEARKTVVYNGQMFNITDTKQFTTTIDGRLPDGGNVNLKTSDKKQIQDMLKKQGGIGVRMAFHFDDKELVYTDSTVKSWGEYDRKLNSFEKAARQVKDLMQKDSATQVTLK